MPWVRVDDHFDEHPKFAKCGPLGMALWIAGLAYCNRTLTDGFIPWSVAHSLLTWQYLGPPEDKGRRVYTIAVTCGMAGDDLDSSVVIELLLRARLWEEVDGGYMVHDYDDYQPTRQQVEEERVKKQAAGQAGGRASAAARAHSNGSARAQAPAQAKSKPVPKPVPGTVSGPVIPPSPSLRSGDAPPKARGNPRVQATIDAFRERGLGHVVFAKRDKGEVAGANADPGLVAEVYEAVESGAYGDEFMRKNLSVHAAVGWVNGYLASQPRAPAPPTSLSVVPSDSHANTFCQPCSAAGRRPHPPGHPGCVATAFRESA